MNYRYMLRKSTPLVLAGGLLVGSGFMLAAERKLEPTVEETIAKAGISLPEKLTPEQPTFDDSKKEYLVYSDLYNAFSADRELNTHEITALESVLSRTDKEIRQKTSETQKNSLVHTPEQREYFEFVRSVAGNDLKAMQTHLAAKEEWVRETHYRFLHHGAGITKQLRLDLNGNIWDLYGTFRPPEDIKRFKSGLYKRRDTLDIKRISDDFPWEDRIPWGAGILLGGILPLLFGYASRKLRGEDILDKAGKGYSPEADIANAALIPVAGFLLLDGIHPLVYPVRLAASLVYPYVFPTGRSTLRPYMKPPKKKKPKPEVKPKNVKIIDPWKVDIPEIKNTLETDIK